jgi:hypothetical protein
VTRPYDRRRGPEDGRPPAGVSVPAEIAGPRQDSPAAAYELAPLGRSAGGEAIRQFRFPGAAERVALILGGVHGSERSGVEVAWRAIDRLAAGASPAWTVYAVPCLFPDNHAAGLREGEVPTNRNFPWPGESLEKARARSALLGGAGEPADSLGVPILPENRLLIELIGRIKPERAASLHATVHPERAGIFADAHGVPEYPVADSEWTAIAGLAAARTAADADLALAMARHARARGARVAGNRLEAEPTALWSGETPAGTSLGGWAPVPVVQGVAEDRPAVSLITVEVDGCAASPEATDPAARAAELEAHAEALIAVFLAP